MFNSLVRRHLQICRTWLLKKEKYPVFRTGKITFYYTKSK